MKNTQCHLCNSENIGLIHKGTRDNQEIDVLKCGECGLVFLSSFDHIHNGFYEKSQMRDHIRDRLAWRQSMSKDNQRRYEQLADIIEGQDVLDYGCGVGGFMELVKAKAQSIDGIELDEAVRNELKEAGYSVWEHVKESNKTYDVITLFHVIEHLENPIEIMKELHGSLNDGGQIIIETPNANDALLTLYRSKAFADFSYWSPHIFLYNEETLTTVMEKAGFKLKWNDPVQRYPLSNHMYWLSDSKPGGQLIFDCLNSEQLDIEYKKMLRQNGMCDTLMMCFEAI